jgi:hypothetical protein
MNASPILASNLSFSLQQFARCRRRVLTVATLDRIVEGSIIISMERDSFRFKYKRRMGLRTAAGTIGKQQLQGGLHMTQ